ERTPDAVLQFPRSHMQRYAFLREPLFKFHCLLANDRLPAKDIVMVVDTSDCDFKQVNEVVGHARSRFFKDKAVPVKPVLRLAAQPNWLSKLNMQFVLGDRNWRPCVLFRVT